MLPFAMVPSTSFTGEASAFTFYALSNLQSARILGKKIKLVSQIIHCATPLESLGIVNPPVPNVMSAPMGSELLDVVAGLACSLVIVVNQDNLFLSGWITAEVKSTLHMSSWLLRTGVLLAGGINHNATHGRRMA